MCLWAFNRCIFFCLFVLTEGPEHHRYTAEHDECEHDEHYRLPGQDIWTFRKNKVLSVLMLEYCLSEGELLVGSTVSFDCDTNLLVLPFHCLWATGPIKGTLIDLTFFAVGLKILMLVKISFEKHLSAKRRRTLWANWQWQSHTLAAADSGLVSKVRRNLCWRCQLSSTPHWGRSGIDLWWLTKAVGRVSGTYLSLLLLLIENTYFAPNAKWPGSFLLCH